MLKQNKVSRLGTSLLLLLGMAGCDFEVTNPGPVGDELLNEPDVFQAVVNGVKREMNGIYSFMGINQAVRTRELHVAELDNWRRVSLKQHKGIADAEPYHDPWNETTSAVWLAKDAIRRAGEIWDGAGFNSSPIVAEAHLWSGYSHRIYADFYCQVVFDGGMAQDSDVALAIAENAFSKAIEIAGAAGNAEFKSAGYAGRASIRIQTGDWAGAVSDAGMVATDFSYKLPFGNTSGEGRLNYFAYGDMSRAHTVWHTPYAEYYTDTGDPRIPHQQGGYPVDANLMMRQTQLVPWNDATGLPWLMQGKFRTTSDAIEVSGGPEMRLIEAEAKLRNSDMAGAMVLINEVRTRGGVVDAWPAPADINEAWSNLKAERGIETWLEMRRFSDFRRWRASNAPGALHKYEIGGVEGEPDLSNAQTCFPISQDEVDKNSNLTGGSYGQAGDGGGL